jgi:hypothetical protein
MSQQWPPAQPDDRAGGSAGQPDEQGTMIGPIAGQPTAGRTGGERLCPSCEQPLDPDSLFCQACGAQVGAPAAPVVEEEKTQPWWILVAVGWLILAAGALFFLYSQAILVGSR